MPHSSIQQVAYAPVPLDDTELVAAWMGGAGGEKAAAWIAERGGLEKVLDTGFTEAVRALGRPTAIKFCAGVEVLRRLCYRRPPPRQRIRCAADVARIYAPRLAGAHREIFLAVALDAKNQVRSEAEIAVGTLSSCPVHPREAFRPLVREAASGVVFVHNHPSGDPTPSPDDRELTERLRQAGDLLGIRLVDHVVVAAEGAFSIEGNERVRVAARG